MTGSKSSGFNFETCVRPNILKLEPYRCARDDYKDDGTNILLDANENAFGPGLHLANGQLPGTSTSNGTSSIPQLDLLGLNRYPDPHQTDLKQLWCDLRNSGAHSTTPLTPENLFVGVGSDEAIDAILRCFCRPGHDKILTCPPTYGMYSVSACVNDLEIVKVPLDTENGFQLRPDAICEALSQDPSIKVVYACSPGNPTGELLRKSDIQKLLEHPTWNGVVVVDEAYVDFAQDIGTGSLASWVPEWPNLIVMQTLSKAFGLAGIRIGAAITDAKIAKLFNSYKAPYNISSPSSALAIHALSEQSLTVSTDTRKKILQQRNRIIQTLPQIPGIGRIRGGKDANFILVEILQDGRPSNEAALAVYEQMAETRGVVVRFRGKEYGCEGCLRVTVGTEHEVDRFLADIRTILEGITVDGKKRDIRHVDGETEEQQELKASKVVA